MKKLLISLLIISAGIGLYLVVKHPKKDEPENLAPETMPIIPKP